MSYLRATLIDVGWGDSILLEASDPGGGRPRFAMIDSNDNADRDYWPSWNFLRKHFGVREDEFTVAKPFFDFVLLTHDHSDHGSGLKRIMKEYGTQHFWYPRVHADNSVILTSLQSYANHSSVRIPNQALDDGVESLTLGDATIDVLWPPPNHIESNPNNNSVVTALSIHNQTILLTGDAEGKVWQSIANQIPNNTVAIKVPHHGSRNGTIYNGAFPWVDQAVHLAVTPELGISCHPNYPNRFDFPHDDVINEFNQRGLPYRRTDLQYHITFEIDDNGFHVRYSH